MKFSAVPGIFYTFSPTESKVSIIDVDSSDDNIVVIEGEFAKLFMELVDQENETTVLSRFSSEEEQEILKMFDILVEKKILNKI